MKITLVTVGKIKEKFYRDAIDEYVKRLGKYCDLRIIEVADEKTKEKASFAEDELVKTKEGERILKSISDDCFVITLEIQGKKLSSEDFSKKINDITLGGKSHICFIIGGSLGLSKNVSLRADFKLSFSDMTFPHQLMRVIFLEQLYRSFRINNNEPYHK